MRESTLGSLSIDEAAASGRYLRRANGPERAAFSPFCTGYSSQKTKRVAKTLTLETRTQVTFEPVTSKQADLAEVQCEADVR